MVPATCQFSKILRSLHYFLLVFLNKICHKGSLKLQPSEAVTENPPRSLMVSNQTTFFHLFSSLMPHLSPAASPAKRDCILVDGTGSGRRHQTLYFSIKRCWILVLRWLVTQKWRVYHTVAEGTGWVQCQAFTSIPHAQMSHLLPWQDAETHSEEWRWCLREQKCEFTAGVDPSSP